MNSQIAPSSVRCLDANVLDELDAIEAVMARRRSVRAFRAEPVDHDLIRRIIGIARMTPSSCNTQPWSVHIASGGALDALRGALCEAVGAGRAPEPEILLAEAYRDAHRERQIGAAVTLYRAQGIERDDKTRRLEAYMRNYAFFGAPHAAFVFVEGAAGMREVADCGKFIQTFLLALAAAGIGACPQGSLSEHPGIVRRTLGLSEPGKLLLGISFGYANEDDVTTSISTTRRPTDDVVAFHETGSIAQELMDRATPSDGRG